jgi:transposase
MAKIFSKSSFSKPSSPTFFCNSCGRMSIECTGRNHTITIQPARYKLVKTYLPTGGYETQRVLRKRAIEAKVCRNHFHTLKLKDDLPNTQTDAKQKD